MVSEVEVENYLRRHPCATCKEISLALEEGNRTIYSVLKALLTLGLLERHINPFGRFVYRLSAEVE